MLQTTLASNPLLEVDPWSKRHGHQKSVREVLVQFLLGDRLADSSLLKLAKTTDRHTVAYGHFVLDDVCQACNDLACLILALSEATGEFCRKFFAGHRCSRMLRVRGGWRHASRFVSGLAA